MLSTVDDYQLVPAYAMTSIFNRQGFDAIIGAYKINGGTAKADDLAMLLEEKNKGNFVSVAKRIASREIFSFEWQNHFLVPMFQFNLHDLSTKQKVRRVVEELTAVLDDWTLALWFAEPNLWLKGRRPVDMVDSHFSSVLHAARADRFVATG